MSNKQRGRPKIGTLVSFTVRPDQKREIMALATLWGVNQSWVVRYLLDQALPPTITNASNPFIKNGNKSVELVAD